MGNIVNRVFDSSGPEGKVRGTPQQIIDKYLILARDAQLGNDRVAAENFLQHAEHYTRMLSEAQREAQAEADARRQQQEAQQNRDRQQGGRSTDGDPQAHDTRPQRRDSDDPRSHEPTDPRNDAAAPFEGDGGSSLVETPESGAPQPHPATSDASAEHPAAKPKPRNTRKPRSKPAPAPAPAPEADAQDSTAKANSAQDTPAEDAAAKPAPRRRAPRKPRSTPQSQDGAAEGGDGGAQDDATPRSATG